MTHLRITLAGLLLILAGIANAADRPCLGRVYNHSSIVCVCNADYCDDISKIQKLEEGQYVLYSSSMSGQRFAKTEGTLGPEILRHKPTFFRRLLNNIMFTSTLSDQVTIGINRNKTYQDIVGFGGSFTDAAGVNILSLSPDAQDNLINSYFAENGLEYNLARVPISGCDFSTHAYAYNMYPENDTLLSNYSLTMEDHTYKIPIIKRAQAVATDEILLTSATWSPPLWMKTNDDWGGASALRPEYYQTWADYHYKFIEEYDKNGVKIWAVSTGNEPSNGIIPVMAFNSLGWLPSTQAKWLSENLGPTIKNSIYSDVKILALDDQRFSLPWWIENMESLNGTLQYIDGIALHWYWNDILGPSVVDRTHEKFPDKFLIATEACVGDKPWETEKVELGAWERGEMYIKDILEELNHWFVGWIDWNLALNRRGGPNWFDNHVDAPIIVLPEADEFVKQPLFYAMGHFSKFIPRGSVRIHVEALAGYIDNVAFLRPDGGIAVVFYNPYDFDKTLIIREDNKGALQVTVEARSVHSLVYW